LQSMAGMAGKILQGEDNAKSGVAIFRDFDPQTGTFDVFVGGLSGLTVIVDLPVEISVTQTDAFGKSREVKLSQLLLSRTLKLTYSVPGEPPLRIRQGAGLIEQTWVMR